MKTNQSLFDEEGTLNKLKHYLPAQSPLKDFVHHNTLHAFQELPFFEALQSASEIFGYQVLLPLDQYRLLHRAGKINDEIIERIIIANKGIEQLNQWRIAMYTEDYQHKLGGKIGQLHKLWKQQYKFDLHAIVHVKLFKFLCSYLDQGISIWNFPIPQMGLLGALKELEKNSFSSFFNSSEVRLMLLKDNLSITKLLDQLVGDVTLYEQYLFDQQFAHPGWSGLVAVLENNPLALLDKRKISLQELIVIELLFELDALVSSVGTKWQPLTKFIKGKPAPLFSKSRPSKSFEILTMWHQAMEWTYYDEVIAGISKLQPWQNKRQLKSFQALFCIDDRECSIRRHLEYLEPLCETYGTPGHFGLEFYYQPEHSKFYTKVCPAPVQPKHIIKENGGTKRIRKDAHFAKHSHHLFGGWLISQTLGFWSALRLFFNIFRPSVSPATSHSFSHMDEFSTLTVENKAETEKFEGLQVGFTITEMADNVEAVLRSIGLVENFANIVYLIGHGSSSVNNTHYAGYDCGACSGRPGSVNARAFSYMANHQSVRLILAERGINIPESTQFLGALHDTSRDEVVFYDEKLLLPKNKSSHQRYVQIFKQALTNNAKERSRRFNTIDSNLDADIIHQKIKDRTVSLFEPRPELNHATNALCIIGRRGLTRGLFLDRRSFMNSYDYSLDPDGTYLTKIINAAAPVCGGINLEYFFSRVDNQKLGAGTKLPHNVMGLIGVANGIEGDLRPGLPSQMIEVHDPLRLLMIIEQKPAVVLKVIESSPTTFEWFNNYWVQLVVFNPTDGIPYVFEDHTFRPYQAVKASIAEVDNLMQLLEASAENLPVQLIKS